MGELGIVLPARQGELQKIGDYARLAERAGFSGVFATEAFIDSLAVSLQAALATERITIGTAITNLYYRHPALVGPAASHIQELSGGRMALGLGTSHQVINAPRGIDINKPLATMRDYVQETKKYVFGDPPPSIHLAALRRGMTRLAGEIADGVILNMVARDRLPDSVAAFREGAARRSDGNANLTVASFLTVCVADDVAAARAVCRQGVAFYCRMEFYRNVLTETGFGPQAEEAGRAWEANDEGKALGAIDDAMVEQHAVFGPVEQCRDRIQEYFNAGLDRIIISPRVAEGDSRNPFDVVVNALGPGA